MLLTKLFKLSFILSLVFAIQNETLAQNSCAAKKASSNRSCGAVKTTSTQNSCSATKGTAFDYNSLIGEWSGTITLDGKKHNVNVDFAMVNGKMKGTAHIPMLKVENQAVTLNHRPGRDLHVTYVFPDERFLEFVGMPEGDVFKGRFNFIENPNMCVKSKDSFTLKRKTKTSASL